MLAALIRKLAWSGGGFCRPFLYILKGNVTTSTAIWTLQTSNGDLQLEEQPKIKQLAHCDQTSWETALIYQSWRAVKCFPTFNCRCVRASGNCKPRGTSVWVLVFLTEQNKHLRGLWMRKVRAHSTHEKLIYSQPSPIKTPPREKGEKKKKKTLLNKWASQVGQAWLVLLTLEWINYLYFEGLKQSVGFLREPTRVPSPGAVGLIPYTSPVGQKQLPKRLIFMLMFFQ